ADGWTRVVHETGRGLATPGGREDPYGRRGDGDAVDRVRLGVHVDLVGIVEKRDQILDDASDEAPAIHIEALLLVRSSDSEARERTQVPEDARLERRADDDREGADPVELHSNGDDHRSKVRFEGPLVHVNEEGCGDR